MNLYSQEIKGLFLIQIVTTLKEKNQHKEISVLPNHTKAQDSSNYIICYLISTFCIFHVVRDYTNLSDRQPSHDFT